MIRILLAAAAVLAVTAVAVPPADAHGYKRHHHHGYYRHGYHHRYGRGYYATSDYYHRSRQLVGTR